MQALLNFSTTKKDLVFIGVEGREQDLFCHFSAIDGDGFRKLAKDQRVEFDIETIDGKERAKNVRVLG